jgi:hypothetical protein
MTDPDAPPSLTGEPWSSADDGRTRGRGTDGHIRTDGAGASGTVERDDVNGAGAGDHDDADASAPASDGAVPFTASTVDAIDGDADALREAVSGLRVLQLTSSRRSFFETQVEGLEALGVDCEVVSVPTRGGRERGRGPREYLAFALRTIGRGLEEFDLVHASYGMLGPLALAQPTRPVVLTLWGSDLMGRGWLSHTSRLSARFADATVVPWPVMSRELSTDHEVVPFGVDTELFRPIPPAEAREHVDWDVDPDERVVLFPYATDRPIKDYPLAERVVERVPDATLRTVSGVDYAEMPYYMNASDALLVTSERESGPMVVREAAACNLPVVSRDVGAAADVLDGVENCAIADSGSALAAALERVLDADGRSNGREAVTELGVDATARHLARVYLSTLD